MFVEVGRSGFISVTIQSKQTFHINDSLSRSQLLDLVRGGLFGVSSFSLKRVVDIVRTSIWTIWRESLNKRSLHEHKRRRMNIYLLTLFLTASAVVFRYGIEAVIGWTSDSFSVLVTLAAFGAAWYGGFRAGLLTTLVGSCFFYFCFVAPRYTIIFYVFNDLLSIIISSFCGIVGSWLCESLHEARRQAEVAKMRVARGVMLNCGRGGTTPR